MSNTEALRAAESALAMALDDLLNLNGSRRSIPAVNTAINTVRAALAQPAETDAELQLRTGEPHIDGWPLYSGLPPAASGEPQAFYKDAAAEPPYAQFARGVREGFALGLREGKLQVANDATAQPAPAPADIAAKLRDPVLVHAAMLRGEIATPAIRDMLHVYGADALARWDATQPAPALVPLTDAQMAEIMSHLNTGLTGFRGWGWLDVARAIEAAHGIGTPAKEAPATQSHPQR